MNRIMISTLLLVACFIWSNAAAQTVQVPNNFQAGMPARASEVNANFSAITNGVNDNAVQLAAVIDRLDALQARVDSLEAQLEALEDNSVLKLNGRLYLDTGDSEKPVAVFAGVNVQIVNGLGQTDSVNGLGNVIVGYDEERDGGVFLCSDGRYDNQAECLNNEHAWSTVHKSGSHNIVVGKENNYSQYGGLVTGLANSIINGFSTVTGGLKNVAAGRHANVSGGTDNVALADRSSVSGGLRNTTEGVYASVTGGRDNLARGDSASVTGGAENRAIGFASSVTGGGGDNFENPGKPRGNSAVGDYATVTGGTDNWAFGQSSTVAGGAENRANGPFSAISGGDSNIAEGYQATVSGGIYNIASGIDSTVSGGQANTAAGRRSTISGGYQLVTNEENGHRP